MADWLTVSHRPLFPIPIPHSPFLSSLSSLYTIISPIPASLVLKYSSRKSTVLYCSSVAAIISCFAAVLLAVLVAVLVLQYSTHRSSFVPSKLQPARYRPDSLRITEKSTASAGIGMGGMGWDGTSLYGRGWVSVHVLSLLSIYPSIFSISPPHLFLPPCHHPRAYLTRT